MALTVSNVATATSTTSGATLAIPGVTASVGDWLIVAVAADNAGTLGAASLQSSMTDSVGNTYTNRTLANRDPGDPNQGTTLGIWTAPITTAITGGTITANFSPNTTAKAALVKKATPATGEQVYFGSAGTAQTGQDRRPSYTTASITSGHTVIFAVAAEQNNAITGDSDTINGAWSADYGAQANTGSRDSSQAVLAQSKTVTGTATQTWDVELTLSTIDYAMNYVVLYDDNPPAVSVAVTGVAGTAELGSVQAFSSIATTLTGFGLTASAGYAAFPAYPTGVQATAQLGDVTLLNAGTNAYADGVQATAELGQLMTNSETVFVTGVAATAALGAVQAASITSVYLTGVQATAGVSAAQVWSYINDSQTPGWSPVVT